MAAAVHFTLKSFVAQAACHLLPLLFQISEHLAAAVSLTLKSFVAQAVCLFYPFLFQITEHLAAAVLKSVYQNPEFGFCSESRPLDRDDIRKLVRKDSSQIIV